jgi:pyruvate,water dikinase
MKTRYVFELVDSHLPKTVGNKAKQLRFLSDKGFRIPGTLVCTWDAYAHYQADNVVLVEDLRSALASHVDPGQSYAVRSSANIEDGLDHSFAGQFKSALNVHGVDGILQAVWSIWALTRAPNVQSYLRKMGRDPDELKMAVVVQEMVKPVYSGVAFSKNPMTGMDEVIVEAVQGSGAALVQGGVTPQRWVNKWGEWLSTPDGEQLDRSVASDIVAQTKAIAKAYGAAVDLEWVYDGRQVYWVQLREITTIKNLNLYSHRIPREMLPGMIKPLIWSINIPLVGGVWKQLLTELIGPNDLDPHRLIKPFYYRAYFNMGTLGEVFESLGFPREALEIMMGVGTTGLERPSFKPSGRTFRHTPRMVRFAADKLTFDRRIAAFIPVMHKRYRAFHFEQAGGLSERELLAEIDKLYALTQQTAYFNIVGPLLMFMHNAMFKGQLRKLEVDFASFDLTHGMDELHEYDPNIHLHRLGQRYVAGDALLKERLAGMSYEQFRQLPGLAEFQREVAQFIEQFGHLSDSGNDFSSVPWRENPDVVLQMLVNAASAPAPVYAPSKTTFEELRLPAPRRWMLGMIYRGARQYRLYREAISSLYTFGYGLFRPYFMALGEHLVRRGILAARDDILFLDFAEVRAAVEEPSVGGDYAHKVAERRREMDEYRHVAIPETIYGDQPPPLTDQTGDRLTGIATSRGYYTGPARVVQGMCDFNKVQAGDVLVIPFSDVGWTPLFTKAGAVIAESGGILSHSSIVAREYNIPAVVSVHGACQLADNARVSVDGYKGEVLVHGGE